VLLTNYCTRAGDLAWCDVDIRRCVRACVRDPVFGVMHGGLIVYSSLSAGSKQTGDDSLYYTPYIDAKCQPEAAEQQSGLLSPLRSIVCSVRLMPKSAMQDGLKCIQILSDWTTLRDGNERLSDLPAVCNGTRSGWFR
jgi:hypothetical protein